MIAFLANQVMFRRAGMLVGWLLRYLPGAGLVADVGSGTGHNAVTLRQRSECDVQQFDVADLHWVGEAPAIFSIDQETAFLPDGQVSCVLLIHVLQYPKDLESLLRRILMSKTEAIVVIQSTYDGRWGKCVFRIQEALFGPIAFHLARLVKLVPNMACPVKPVRHLTTAELTDALKRCELAVCNQESRRNWLLGTGDELLVCRRIRE